MKSERFILKYVYMYMVCGGREYGMWREAHK